MGYLGNPPTSAAFVTDTFNGTGSQTAYTMSVAPASTSSMLVIVGAVLQDPSTYSIVGMTLNFSSPPPSGTGNISVRYMGIPASGVANTAYRTVTDFTATAGQTTITVPSYTVGFIDVFRNGARLGATDFTATNGTSITLAVAANANDLITTVSFSVQSVLNAIPATPNSVLPYIGNRALSTSQMPAGTVLQVVTGQNTNQVVISADGTYDIGVSASITIQQNSRILVDVVVPVYADSAGGGAWAGTQVFLYEGSTMLVQTEHVGTVTNEAQCVQIPLICELTSRNAGTYSFALKAGRVLGGSRYVKRDNRLGVLKLTEIAA